MPREFIPEAACKLRCQVHGDSIQSTRKEAHCAADAGVSAVGPGWAFKQTPFHNDVESACPSLTICLLSGAASVRKESIRMS